MFCRRSFITFAVALCACALKVPAWSQVPATLNAALQTAAPGSIVDLDGASAFSYLNQNPNQLPQVTGNLIYSDDPETVPGTGILYRDLVGAGSTRVYLYHVNGSGSSAKITAVLQNAGGVAANVQFSRKSLAGPSGNYVSVGRLGVQRYYENTALPASLSIPVGSAALLDSALDSTSVANNQLVSAIYDFSSDQNLTVTALMLSSSANTLSVFSSQSVLASDGNHRQGTFTKWGKENTTPYSYSTSSNVAELRLADGSSFTDPNLTGIDAERSVSTTLPGGFGVTYRIRVNVTSNDGRRLAVLLNPRGGAYGGYVRTTFPESTGAPTGQLVPNPTANLSDSSKAIVCSKIIPSSSAQTLLLELIPAGASSLPIELLLVPYTPPSGVAGWGTY